MRVAAPGSARTLLLAALALAAAVMVVSAALLATQDSEPERRPAGEDEEDEGDESDEAGLPPSRARTRAAGEETDESPSDVEGLFLGGADPRDPSGDEYHVTPDTLRAVLEARHWEEIRRMIDVLQAPPANGTVPDDVVKALVAMLEKEDLRLDAVLALGGVKDPDTGRRLAELALSSEATPETRQAALDALAKSGQPAALAAVQQLVATEGLDDGILRHALPALAGIGGREATRTLLDLLVKHRDDDLRGAVIAALGKAKESDPSMAQSLREARTKGEGEALKAMLLAAQIQGPALGAEVKQELLLTVEGSGALDAFEDEVERQLVQGSAMPAAVAAGHVAPVLRHATTSGPLRDIALNALREARGDEAARQIAEALARSSDDAQRALLAAALGRTGSREATPTLVALLDDRSETTRRAAAYALSEIRDPAAVKPIAARLLKSEPDFEFARNLVHALGTIGANEAIATLDKVETREEAFWRQLRPHVQNARVRIRTGNPESERTQ